MGVVYYGNYAMYCEVGRVEAMRAIGWPYKRLEDDGIMLPVLEYKTKYLKPAKYDDLLTIETQITQLPQARIHFAYHIYNEQGTLLNVAETTLVFVNMASGRPCSAPDAFLEALRPHFN